MFIISVAFAGLMQSFPLGLAINREAENASIASFLAQAKIEELESLDYSLVSLGEIEAKHRLAATPADYLYSYQRQTITSYVDENLNESGVDIGLIKATVTVYYIDALSKGEKSYNITTLIAQK